MNEEGAVPWELFHSLSPCSSRWITQGWLLGVALLQSSFAPSAGGWLPLVIWNNTLISLPLCAVSTEVERLVGSCGSREVCDTPGVALQAPDKGTEVWAAREDQKQNSFLWGKLTSRIRLQF